MKISQHSEIALSRKPIARSGTARSGESASQAGDQVQLSGRSRLNPVPWRKAVSALAVALTCCAGLMGPAGAATGQNWNATLARNFEDSQARQIPHFRDLTSWKQGQHGNCTTVAFAKASNAVWGGRLYPQVEKDGQGGYSIQTQNQRRFSLTAEQLQSAVRMADFRGPDNASKAQAIVTVGVLGQCYADTHQVSYQQALDLRANKGASAGEFARCLGIPYWESSDTSMAVTSLAAAGQSQAGVVEALFWNQGKLEGHVEAMMARPDGTVVGDAYGVAFQQSLKSPSVRIEGQDIPASRVALLGESWKQLSPEALKNSVRDQALELMILQPAPPDLRKKASLTLDLLDASETDLHQIQASLTDRQERSRSYADWFGRLAPNLSPKTGERMFAAVTLRMAYDQDLSPEQRRMADLLHTSGSSLSSADRSQLARLLLNPPQDRAESLASAILQVTPRLSAQGSSELTRASLSLISRWPQASDSERKLADGIYRDFQVEPAQRPLYHQKLLQAIAEGSRQEAGSIRDGLNSKAHRSWFGVR
ncbi:hypothetical protein JST97_04000 [bacterium]|nr:hypothetical protein [bacterium]